MNSYSLILILLPIWSTLGNILVIISVIREKRLHNMTNYLVINLAIADLLISICAMPFHIYVTFNENYWSFSVLMCDMSLSIDSICAASSKFTLCAIGVERFMAVIQPFRYRSIQFSHHRVRIFILISLIWIISITFTIPFFLFGINQHPRRVVTICTFYNLTYVLVGSVFTFWIPGLVLVFVYVKLVVAIRVRTRKVSKLIGKNTEIPVGKDNKDIPQLEIPPEEFKPQIEEDISNNYKASLPEIIASSSSSSDCQSNPDLITVAPISTTNSVSTQANLLALPSLNMNQSSSSTVASNQPLTALSSADAFSNSIVSSIAIPTISTSNTLQSQVRKSEKKATLTMALVLAAFFICWAPFYSTIVVQFIVEKLNHEVDYKYWVKVHVFTGWIAYFNSCLNFIIYAVFNPQFRSAFRNQNKFFCDKLCPKSVRE